MASPDHASPPPPRRRAQRAVQSRRRRQTHRRSGRPIRHAAPADHDVAGQAEIAGEVDQRLEEPETALLEKPALYLFVYGLQRARDLRQEEDFGFSSFSMDDEPTPVSPAQQFATILQEGPDLGVHTLVWCNAYTNLTRTLDRRSLREFEMRVAFQMSAEDSANLIDVPAASKLGPYRALFYSEEEVRMEKFRPYALPSDEWLASVEERVRGKGTAQGG